ncbi:hypothetical protein [Fodinicola feengrottensis]|uniref:Uncharacterized protein n=1 Tax=Fodinicola feengrottensis TaxID=435914 RepID=A0ABN2HU07_9ACTN|nr:hypothetical protein [Fodinicola feengrottensis]
MIDVQVRTEAGEILSRISKLSIGVFFQAELALYPLLGHIVPWADMVFNSSQLKVLSREVARYEADPVLNPSGESFDWLQEMCDLVAEAGHRILWFVGD